MELRCNFLDLDGGDGTWIEVRHLILGLGVVELPFFGHGWRWDVTGMEMRCKYQDLDWAETRPGWSWDFNMGACMEVKCEYGGLDWIEIQPRWRRDANLWTLMETVHGWRRDKNLVAWISLIRTRMEVRLTYWNLFRGKYMDLDWGETRSGWGGDLNLGA